MTRIGFIGRTKFLFDTIIKFQKLKDYEISFIWTSQDEEFYNFGYDKFEKLAAKVNCLFINSSNIKTHANSISADIVVSVNFINVIPQDFIEKFKFGIINAHAGDLPRYKGNACPNWAILNQEEFVALTLHKMNSDLDSGPIIFKDKFKIKRDTYVSEIYEWLEEKIPKSFVMAVEHLCDGRSTSDQAGKTLRTFPRKPEDARLDFSKDLNWNYRLIRASSKPFDGAFAYLNNSSKKIIIYRAEPVEVKYDFLAVSGQIIERFSEDASFLLAIGENALKITSYSLDGLSIKKSFKVVCDSMRNRLT